MRIAHVAVDLGLRRERRHGIDHDHIQRTALAELLADGERLFAGVRLRDDEIVKVHADLLRVAGIERMFRIDERGDTAVLLRVRHHVQGQRRLAARLLTVAFHDTSAREPAHAEREIERQRARGDHWDVRMGMVSELHDGKLAELLPDLRQDGVQCRVRLLRRFVRLVFLLCHLNLHLCLRELYHNLPPAGRNSNRFCQTVKLSLHPCPSV